MNSIISFEQLRLHQLIAKQWQRPLTPKMRSNILKHRIGYSEIEHDNQNILWLYNLILAEEMTLPRGEVIAAMRQRLLDEDALTPMAWRYIANGSAQDFRIVIDAEEPTDTPNWRWKGLVYWLQILSGLKLDSAIPQRIQYLFLHDSLIVMPELEEVQFRGAWVNFGALRHIIKEAIKQLELGTLDQFIATDLVEVITWLANIDCDLDSNQTKQGWKYLVKKASEWKADIVSKAAYKNLKWDSVLGHIQLNGYSIAPIIDAWSLHKLALTQRHCGDSFIEGCINGSERIFVITNTTGKIIATLRLTHADDTWTVGDMRGFANAEVSYELTLIGIIVAQHFSDNSR